jgi:hypothetical protein
MLEFTAGLFINSSPNETAWAATLTEFLSTQGYILATEVSTHNQLPCSFYLMFCSTKDSLQHQCGNALEQYQVLVQVIEAEVVKSVEVAWNLTLAACVMPSAEDFKAKLLTVDESTPLFECPYLSSESCNGHILQLKSGEVHQCPSAYLHSRCPLCFGGRPPVPQENMSGCLKFTL